MAELSEAFHESVLPFKVDVVDWAMTTPSFRKVVENGKVLLQKNVARAVPIVSSSAVSDFHAVAKVRGPAVITGLYGTIGQVFYSDARQERDNESVLAQPHSLAYG